MDKIANIDPSLPADFDPEWYLQTYPDVTQIGMDPAAHYVWIGKRLGRRPNALSVAISAPAGRNDPVDQLSLTPEDDANLPPMPVDPGRWARLRAHITRHPPVPLAPLFRSFNPDAMNLHWIVAGELPLDARQTRVFSLVRQLEAMGHRSWIWIQPPCEVSEAAFHEMLVAQDMIGPRTVLRMLPEDIIGISGDAIISTDFWSCFPAAAMPLFKSRFRLAQCQESECQTNGSALALAQRARGLDFMALCAGNDVREAFEQSGGWARDWPEFADERCFFPAPARMLPSPAGTLQIAVDLGGVIASHVASDLTLDALELLAQRGVNFTAHGFGEVPAGFDPTYAFVPHGLLGPVERGNLFRTCHIGVSLTTGLDRATRMEMLACGLETIGLFPTGSARSENGLHLVDASSAAVAEAISSAGTSANLLRTDIKIQGSDARDKGAQAVAAALLEGLETFNKPVAIAHALASASYEHKAAVIIPTWNGGALFRDVLESLTTQSTPWSFEVLVVDSGSTDETLEITRSYAGRGVRLHSIPNSEFQHGRTRNLAISLTSAEFVAVLTQDATPANPYWLANLVKSFDKGAKVAGVFGAHQAYPDATPFVSMGIQGHFEHFNRLAHVAHWDAHDDIIPFGSTSWQNWLHYYSDNNSCMRRSVWEHIPYPDIDWGEDQVWAWEIVKQGYDKAFAENAIVYHSHNLNNKQQFKVSKIEGQFWLKNFNYKFESSPEQILASAEYLRDRDRKFSQAHNIPNTVTDEQVELNRVALSARYMGQAELLRTIYGAIG